VSLARHSLSSGLTLHCTDVLVNYATLAPTVPNLQGLAGCQLLASVSNMAQQDGSFDIYTQDCQKARKGLEECEPTRLVCIRG